MTATRQRWLDTGKILDLINQQTLTKGLNNRTNWACHDAQRRRNPAQGRTRKSGKAHAREAQCGRQTASDGKAAAEQYQVEKARTVEARRSVLMRIRTRRGKAETRSTRQRDRERRRAWRIRRRVHPRRRGRARCVRARRSNPLRGQPDASESTRHTAAARVTRPATKQQQAAA